MRRRARVEAAGPARRNLRHLGRFFPHKPPAGLHPRAVVLAMLFNGGWLFSRPALAPVLRAAGLVQVRAGAL